MGRPLGSPNKDKPFRDALRMVLADAENNQNNPRKLRRIAEILFDRAAEGDVQAIKEVADRLDGKPAQSHIGGDESDPAIQVTGKIEMIPLLPASEDD